MIKFSINNLSILLYISIVTITFSKTTFLAFYIVLIICLATGFGKKITLTFNKSPFDILLLLFLTLILIWNHFYIRSLNSGHPWESEFHNTVFPLSGDNVNIVPSSAKGFLLDSTYFNGVENGLGYFETLFQTLRVKKGDSLKTSVYCFVSKEFNGDSVRLLVKGSVYGIIASDYKIFDTHKEHLSIENNLISNGDFKLGLANWIPYADSTTHTIIKTPFGNGIRVSRTNGSDGDWSLRYVGRPIIYHAGHRYQIRFLYKIQKGNGIPFSVGWWVDEGSGFIDYYLPLKIKKIGNGWNEATCSRFFNQTHYDLVTFLNSLQDYSVVDITNVEMTDMDRNDTIPSYVDQINKRGTWQKLNVTVPCNTGRASVWFSIFKNNVVDSMSLKGYVIFALPEWEK